jgi:hypothetical protein
MKVKLIKESILDEAKEDDVKDKYGLHDSGPQPYHGDPYPHFAYKQIVKWVNRERPSRIKFLDWMAKQIAGTKWDDNDALDNVYNVILPAAERFSKHQGQFKEKDINKYEDAEAVMAAYKTEIEMPLVAKVRKKRATPAGEHADVVYEDDRFFVVNPKTTKGSCYYGAKTKWCISQKDNRHFNRYVGAGKVFYFIRDDTKKNNDNFYALAVQYNKYTGRREQLWDRRDNSYGPEDWPVRAYGEASEAPIMGAIDKHFEENYKSETVTMEELKARIESEEFDHTGNLGDYLSYDVIFESTLYDDGKLEVEVEYHLYWTPKPSIQMQMHKAGGYTTRTNAEKIFSSRKNQIYRSMMRDYPMRQISLEWIMAHNQMNITGERRFSMMDVGHAVEWLRSTSNSAEKDCEDLLNAFMRAWNHHVLEYIENTTKKPSLDEGKKQIKVKIK